MRIGIIGGGIIGSYLAWKLSNEHEVYVFERKKKIGKESCSGLISERLWNFIPRDNRLIKNVIYSVNIHFNKRDITVEFFPRDYVIDRVKLDNYVAKLAMENGANFFLNHNFRKLFYFRGKKPQIAVHSKGKSYVYEFDYIIGADGANSSVRRQITKKSPKIRLGIKTYVSKYDKSHSVDVWPTYNGFFWKIPRGRNIEYGIFENPVIAKRLFDRYTKKFKIKRGKVYASTIPCGLVTGKDRVILCGDAAGLTKSWSGGGVIWGLYAADYLIKVFPNISKYNLWLERFYRPKIFFSSVTTKLVTFLGKHFPFILPKKNMMDPDWVF